MEIRCINYEQLTKSTPAPPASHQSLACVSAGNWRGPRRHSPLFRCVSVFFFFFVFFVCVQKKMCVCNCAIGALVLSIVSACLCEKGCVNSWFSLNSTLQRDTKKCTQPAHTSQTKKKKEKKNNSRVYVCELKVLLLYLEVIWCADALQRETKKMLERSVKDWNRQRTKTKKRKEWNQKLACRVESWMP